MFVEAAIILLQDNEYTPKDEIFFAFLSFPCILLLLLFLFAFTFSFGLFCAPVTVTESGIYQGIYKKRDIKWEDVSFIGHDPSIVKKDSKGKMTSSKEHWIYVVRTNAGSDTGYNLDITHAGVVDLWLWCAARRSLPWLVPVLNKLEKLSPEESERMMPPLQELICLRYSENRFSYIMRMYCSKTVARTRDLNDASDSVQSSGDCKATFSPSKAKRQSDREARQKKAKIIICVVLLSILFLATNGGVFLMRRMLNVGDVTLFGDNVPATAYTPFISLLSLCMAVVLFVLRRLIGLERGSLCKRLLVFAILCLVFCAVYSVMWLV